MSGNPTKYVQVRLSVLLSPPLTQLISIRNDNFTRDSSKV